VVVVVVESWGAGDGSFHVLLDSRFRGFKWQQIYHFTFCASIQFTPTLNVNDKEHQNRKWFRDF